MFKKRQPSSRRKIRDIQIEQKGIKKEEPEKNEQSVIIIYLVFMFILCHFLRAVLNIQELVYFEWKLKEIKKGCAGVKYWAMILVPFSEFMLLTNSSANFFIYFLCHNDFRLYIQKLQIDVRGILHDRISETWTHFRSTGYSIRVCMTRLCFSHKLSNNSFNSNDCEERNKIEMEDNVQIHDGYK